MHSSKAEYRLMTAPNGMFDVQYRPLGFNKIQGWSFMSIRNTKEKAIEAIKEYIEADNFKPEIVEI